MNDERSSDREFERVWRAIEIQGQQIREIVSTVSDVAASVQTHTAVCTKAEEARTADRREMKGDLAETKAVVKGIAKAQEDKAAVVRLVKRVSGWVGGAATAVAGTWAFLEHAWPALARILGRQAVVLLIAGDMLA